MSSSRGASGSTELVRKKRYAVLGIASAVLLVGVLAAFFLPRSYESSTRVRVVDNRGLHELYGRSLGETRDAQSWIEAIRSSVLSEASMEELNRLTEAGEEERPEAVARLEEDTRVEVLEQGRGDFVLKIAHRAADPETARVRAGLLATRFQRVELRNEGSGAAETLRALREESAAKTQSEKRLTQELARFEGEHDEYDFGRPEKLKLEHLNLSRALEEVDAEIEKLTGSLAGIREQVRDEPVWTEVEHQVKDRKAIAGVEQRIAQAEDELNTLRKRLPDDNILVKEQKALLTKLGVELKKLENDVRTEVRRTKNAVYEELKKSEMETLSALTVKKQLRTDHAARLEALEKKIAAFPALHTEWKGMVDSLEATRKRLAELQEEEGIAESRWRKKVAAGTLIYDVLDAPERPTGPVSPNRMLILGALAVIGLSTGVVVVMIRDSLDRSFRTPEQMAGATRLPVLGAITVIRTEVEREVVRKQVRMAAVTAVVLLLLASAAVFVQVKYDEQIGSFIRNTIGAAK